MPATKFTGFPPDTMEFLAALAHNNKREWFNKHKQRYEEVFLAPSLAYIEAMQAPLKLFSPVLDAVPKKMGGSLMRIYRDTRFAKDKTPYKTNIGIHFRHTAGCDVHAPGCYVHIEPKQCFFGVGTWHPASEPLGKIRQHIAIQPTAWKRVRDGKKFREQFELAGDSLKRPPRGFDVEHPMIEDMKRNDFIAVCHFDVKLIERPAFVQTSMQNFKTAKPFMRFLCEAIGVPF